MSVLWSVGYISKLRLLKWCAGGELDIVERHGVLGLDHHGGQGSNYRKYLGYMVCGAGRRIFRVVYRMVFFGRERRIERVSLFPGLGRFIGSEMWSHSLLRWI